MMTTRRLPLSVLLMAGAAGLALPSAAAAQAHHHSHPQTATPTTAPTQTTAPTPAHEHAPAPAQPQARTSAPARPETQGAPIVLPGAPGQAPRRLTAAEAIRLADTRFSPADVMFMQMMIVHHQQAVEMSRLVKTRTSNADVRRIADRIESAQADEMKFMTRWLAEHGQPVEMAGMGHAGHDSGGSAPHTMQGMATPAQMKALAEARGTAFDRQFLTMMIAHHQGALEMVKDLRAAPGSAYEPRLFQFTNDVVTDQTAEITQMNGMLARLSADPRATLKPGFRDAGQAIRHLRLVTAMPKPAGFFDPANPAQLQPRVAEKDKGKDKDAAPARRGARTAGGRATPERRAERPAERLARSPAQSPAKDAARAEEPPKPEFTTRGSLLDFANTDMAFSGDMLVTGSYHGFNAYRLGADGVPSLVSSTVCPGGQGDVSIVGKMLIMSVEDQRGRTDCGLQGVNERISAERFRGLRIFDVSDWRAPRQVGQVQTCRGSHTHSVVTADPRRIIVYNSGTSGVRDAEELAGCQDAGGDSTALFSIDVVEIPVADPGRARVVDRPRVFAREGEIAGLWRGGDHGEGTQSTNRTDQCHDITVFPALKLAAGACSGNGIILDIADPLKPRRIDDVADKGFAYWHSATFNNDGTRVIFTDEWGGGGRPRCQAGDPMHWGANAFYAIEGRRLVARGSYKLAAPQSDMENCVAHNGSIIPVPGRDIFVQAWYQGGISVIDFTDPARPFEIAYFDRGPIDKDQLVTGGYWSAYWYRGRIYATEIARGLDVFALEPSEFLTAEEIAAAEAAIYPGDVFNPQTQTQVSWPEALAAAAQASRKGG